MEIFLYCVTLYVCLYLLEINTYVNKVLKPFTNYCNEFNITSFDEISGEEKGKMMERFFGDSILLPLKVIIFLPLIFVTSILIDKNVI